MQIQCLFDLRLSDGSDSDVSAGGVEFGLDSGGGNEIREASRASARVSGPRFLK